MEKLNALIEKLKENEEDSVRSWCHGMDTWYSLKEIYDALVEIRDALMPAEDQTSEGE